jgi:DNA-binding NtrC family response regulator
MMANSPLPRENLDMGSKTSTSSRKKRILVVDDERDITDAIRSALKSHYWVDVGGSSSQALSSYRVGFYDLILLDYRMPNIDGFAFYQQIKRIDPKVKVCFITAYEQLQTKITNMQWQNQVNSIFKDDVTLPVLKKPFDTATLLATISRLLGE